MSRYTVNAERSGKWWALQCVEVPAAISQVARLEDAAEIIREVIVQIADVGDSSIEEIEVIPVLPEQVSSLLDSATAGRQEAARLTKQAAEQTRQAVHELKTRHHLTMREIGPLLGISHQRATQLAKAGSESNVTDINSYILDQRTDELARIYGRQQAEFDVSFYPDGIKPMTKARAREHLWEEVGDKWSPETINEHADSFADSYENTLKRLMPGQRS